MQPDSGEAGELLRAYACSDSESDAAAKLDRLFGDYIGRWCANAARRTLRNYGVRGADQTDEESDVAAEVVLQMAARLQDIRRGASPLIGNLRAYAVTAVYNACFARIRARCPRHVQLQNRIRYLLRNDREFATWTADDGEQLAGLRAWTGQQQHVPAPVPQRSGDSLKLVLRSVFRLAQGAVRVNDLLGAAANSLGIADDVISPLRDDGEYAGAEPAADRVMMEREALVALWQQVVQLPQMQRSALLLNLRDAGGQGVIELIPATGTATFGQLAETLNLSQAALAALWPELPLEDARIAVILGLTRQQVINLRKSARDRLARRQRKADGNTVAASASGEGKAGSVGRRIRAIFHRGQDE